MTNINENIFDKLSKITMETPKKFEHIANIESKVSDSKKVVSSGVRMVGDNKGLFESLGKVNLDASKIKINSVPDSGDFDFLKK